MYIDNEEKLSTCEVGESVILFGFLSCSGVKIPDGLTSVQNLTPSTFFSVSAQSIRIITNHIQTPSFPQFDFELIADYCEYYLSSCMADRFKICSQLASAVTELGFNFTFNNFLYPSEEDYCKLIRFFVSKLSELPPQQPNQISSNNSANNTAHLKAGKGFTTTVPDLKSNTDLLESTSSRNRDSSNKDEVSYAVAETDGLEYLKTSKEVDQEIEAVLAETKKRDEELSVLLASVENQPKVTPSRRSYIQRVIEITKNSRKQDADIERILKDTRELQLESNYIRERLNRTYAVVDETLFREGKKDPVGQQAYKLLTNIHESFEQISDKIVSTDRLRREAAEYEGKLSALSRQSFSVEKLQADLDAIRRENEFLERHRDNDDESKIL